MPKSPVKKKPAAKPIAKKAPTARKPRAVKPAPATELAPASGRAPVMPATDAASLRQLRELKKLGIVIHYKGKYFYVFEEEWKRRELPANSSGVAKALVERGTYVAHTGAIAAPLGGWSSLLNLSAVIKGASSK